MVLFPGSCAVALSPTKSLGMRLVLQIVVVNSTTTLLSRHLSIVTVSHDQPSTHLRTEDLFSSDGRHNDRGGSQEAV